jgi:glycine oxidase
MTRGADVLVLGGGIAGLTVALAAAARGLSVIVVDTARPGSASRTAAGMLAPSLEGLPSGVRSAALAARDMYPRYLAALTTRTGIHVSLNREGILELAESEAELARYSARAGEDATTLASAELAHLVPAFAGHAGAVLHPGDGCVDNVALMLALDIAVTLEPRIARLNEGARTLLRDEEPAAVQTAAGSRLEATHLVIAAGAWTDALAGLPRPLPVRPVRGQLLTMASSPIAHVTYGGGGYLVPRGERLLVGATSEDTGFELATTAAGLAELRAVVARALPALADEVVVEHWAGFRPMSPDGMPILGADPADSRIVYACGFSRNGILFAPWAAHRLAALLAGERPDDTLDSFSVGRFAQNS